MRQNSGRLAKVPSPKEVAHVPSEIPQAFHIMAKPSGSAYNLQCDYCFFLKKEKLYPGSSFCMSEKVHEAYIHASLN
jgi:sulfatase maturation enzyme AslB (radical SAM superfamily)